jgi:hypothetical protein
MALVPPKVLVLSGVWICHWIPLCDQEQARFHFADSSIDSSIHGLRVHHLLGERIWPSTHPCIPDNKPRSTLLRSARPRTTTGSAHHQRKWDHHSIGQWNDETAIHRRREGGREAPWGTSRYGFILADERTTAMSRCVDDERIGMGLYLLLKGPSLLLVRYWSALSA